MKDKYQDRPELRLQEYDYSEPELPETLKAGISFDPVLAHDTQHSSIAGVCCAKATDKTYRH